MPAVSNADKTTLNTFPQGTKLAMAVFQPRTMVSAEISGTPAVGAATVVLTNIVTTATPAKHMSVWAGSAAGLSDGGKVRMKSLSGSTLTTAPNFIDWQTYSYVTIKEVIDPVSILPDLGNDYEDGNVSYSNENTNYHPLGRIGPIGMVGYTDQAVKFHSNSTAMATGATIASHAWTFPSGSPGSSSSAGTEANPIEVTWSTATGHQPHYVKYVVTDDNGKTHTRRMPVWIFDSITDAYCDWTLDSLSGSFSSGGWTGTFTVWQDADISNFPEDAMVVIFAQDHYAGHETSIGGNWRYAEHIVFGGWISRDTVHRDNEKGSVTFDVLGPVEKMKELLCWPANLEDDSSPDGWHELSRMTADRAAFHIITEHTTMDQICDVNLTGSTKRMLYIDIPEDDPFTQINDYCLKPIGGNLLSDRQGHIYFDLNPNLMVVSQRSSIATVHSLTIDSPIRADPGLSLAVEEHEKLTAQVDFVAFGYSGEDPRAYYSLAPGDQYITGEVKKIDGIRADSQSESNALAGLYLANENNIWKEVAIPVFNWRIFDIAPQEYTEMTLVAADTRRGIVWSAQKLICRSVSIEYDHEKSVLKVSPTFEKDSFGPAGITGDYPDVPPKDTGTGITPIVPIQPPTINPQDLLIGDLVNGVWWLPIGATLWVERNTGLETTAVTQVGWNPWWFTPEEKNTTNPEEAIIWNTQESVIYEDKNLGKAWKLKIPIEDPPNDWSDSPAPTVSDLTYIQRTDNIHKHRHHYFLGTWQNASDEWRSWVLVTEDDGDTWQWVSLHDLMGGGSCDATYCFGGFSSVEKGSTTEKDISVSGTFSGDAGGDATTFTHVYYSGGGYLNYFNIIVDFGEVLTVSGTSTVNVHIKSDPADAVCQNGWFIAVNGIDWSADGISWTAAGGSTGWADESGSYVWTAAATIPSDFQYVKLKCGPTFEGGDCDGWNMYIDSVRASNVTGTGGAPGEIRAIWMDTDSEDGSTLNITAWTDADKLKLLRVLTADYSASGTEVDLGSCTIAELNNGTYYAAPYTPTFTKNRVYIFGRMSSPAGLSGVQHLIQSADGGSTFTSGENGLGTSVLTNFRAEGFADGARTWYGVVSAAASVPKMYRGAESLSYVSDISDLPVGLVNVDAFAIRFPPDSTIATIAVGSNTAQSVMVVQSEDDGATWADATLNLPTTGEIKTCVFV